MDLNIGAAFYFLSRGKGFLRTPLPLTNDNTSAVALSEMNLNLQSSYCAVKSSSLKPYTNTTCPLPRCNKLQKPKCAFATCKMCCTKLHACTQAYLDGNIELANEGFAALGISNIIEYCTQAKERVASNTFFCSTHRINYIPKTPEEIQRTARMTPAAIAERTPYQSKSRVFLVGIGADEQLAGYARHRTAFLNGGSEALRAELQLDISRIWQRNLGRDDRCISSFGHEARFPYLDEHVMMYLSALPVEDLLDVTRPRGVGDKFILRLVAQYGLHLKTCTTLAKRAIQFGTRLAKYTNAANGGSSRQASGRSLI